MLHAINTTYIITTKAQKIHGASIKKDLYKKVKVTAG